MLKLLLTYTISAELHSKLKYVLNKKKKIDNKDDGIEGIETITVTSGMIDDYKTEITDSAKLGFPPNYLWWNPYGTWINVAARVYNNRIFVCDNNDAFEITGHKLIPGKSELTYWRKGGKHKVGLVGKTGPPGRTGPRGPVGPPGKGEKGDKGENGAKGPAGAEGKQGPEGKPGPKGVAGPKGDRGETGPRGEKGPSGGKKGDKGDKGDRGPKGEQGTPGEKGARGKEGATGPSGKQGQTGPKGEPGGKGEPGTKGKDGAKGPAGKKGEPGKQGEAGKQGKTGKTGKKGEPGKPEDVLKILAKYLPREVGNYFARQDWYTTLKNINKSCKTGSGDAITQFKNMTIYSDPMYNLNAYEDNEGHEHVTHGEDADIGNVAIFHGGGSYITP